MSGATYRVQASVGGVWAGAFGGSGVGVFGCGSPLMNNPRYLKIPFGTFNNIDLFHLKIEDRISFGRTYQSRRIGV